MRRLFLAILPVFFAATFSSMPASAAKQKWFGCPQGYALQVTKDKKFARCAKPRKFQRVPLSCVGLQVPGFTVGAILKVDASGKADKCVIANTTQKAAPLCPPLFKIAVRSGKDSCFRTIRIPPRPVGRAVSIQR